MPPRADPSSPKTLAVIADELTVATHDVQRAAGEQGAVWHPLSLRIAELTTALRDAIVRLPAGSEHL